MQVLSQRDLVTVNGGAIASIVKIGLLGIAGAAVFVASVIYGYIHPNKCN